MKRSLLLFTAYLSSTTASMLAQPKDENSQPGPRVISSKYSSIPSEGNIDNKFGHTSIPPTDSLGGINDSIRKKQPSKETFVGRFVQHLQSLVSTTGLDVSRFETQSESLSSQLSVINHWRKKASRPQKFNDNFRFANKMFHAMKNSAKYSKLYTLSDTGNILVRNLINLNVVLFGFFDSRGLPDPYIYAYKNSVTRLNTTLQVWQNIFEDLEAVPGDMRLVFETTLAEAKKTLSILAGHI
ncbi:hypothetical protein JCM33374_g1566 [Metschnikowia sp. JCM 33374]|nr:hypothetical protein JCM33374_g1566 [Metschnikowia sp. JCM 33374]